MAAQLQAANRGGRLTRSAHTSGNLISSVMSWPVRQDVRLAAGPACWLTSMCCASGPTTSCMHARIMGQTSMSACISSSPATTATSSRAAQQLRRAHLVLLLEVDKGVARLAVPDVGESCLHAQPEVITDDLQASEEWVISTTHSVQAPQSGSPDLPVSRSAYLPVDARDCSSRKGNAPASTGDASHMVWQDARHSAAAAHHSAPSSSGYTEVQAKGRM